MSHTRNSQEWPKVPFSVDMYRAQIERALAQKLKVQAVVYITQKYSAYVDANHAVPPVVLTPAVKVRYGYSMAALWLPPLTDALMPPPPRRRATCKTPAATSMAFSRRPRAACPPTAAPCRPAPTSCNGRYAAAPSLAPTFSFLFGPSLRSTL